MNYDGLKKIGIMLAGIVVGVIGAEAVGIAIWSSGDIVVSYCAEQDIPPAWHEQCIKNLGNYNEIRPIFQIVGVIVGLVVAVTAVKKLFG